MANKRESDADSKILFSSLLMIELNVNSYEKHNESNSLYTLEENLTEKQLVEKENEYVKPSSSCDALSFKFLVLGHCPELRNSSPT